MYVILRNAIDKHGAIAYTTPVGLTSTIGESNTILRKIYETVDSAAQIALVNIHLPDTQFKELINILLDEHPDRQWVEWIVKNPRLKNQFTNMCIKYTWSSIETPIWK